MNRQEHLDWCKKRALEYLDQGDVVNAIASMMSDMTKHEETAPAMKSPTLIALGLQAAMDNVGEARRFIEGFN